MSVTDTGDVTGVNLCEIHNTSIPFERKRLADKFPPTENILVPNRNRSLYVKGRILCTRTFGDLALKDPDLNIDSQKHPKIANWNGPYITHMPDLACKKLTNDMKYLILGSDGLWDEVSVEDAAEIVANCIDADHAARTLTAQAIENAAARRRLRPE